MRLFSAWEARQTGVVAHSTAPHPLFRREQLQTHHHHLMHMRKMICSIGEHPFGGWTKGMTSIYDLISKNFTTRTWRNLPHVHHILTILEDGHYPFQQNRIPSPQLRPTRWVEAEDVLISCLRYDHHFLECPGAPCKLIPRLLITKTLKLV